jgi:hypothetical protein
VTLNRFSIPLGVLLTAASLAWASPASADEWESDLGFYAWLAGIDGTIGVSDDAGIPVDASFSDLAGFVDFAGAMYFEARQPKFALQTDLSLVKLGEAREAQVGESLVDVELDFDQWIWEVGGAYRLTPRLDAWLAGRLYSMQGNATFQGSSLNEASETWADVYLGARFHTHLARRLVASARADIGAGGSDFAWFGNVVLGYEFTETFTLGVGYRILSLDRVSGSGGDYFKYDMTQDGLGIAFNFAR